MKLRTVSAIFVLAMTAALSGAVASTAQADVGADCSVLGPVAGGAISALTPIQSLPHDQAQAARDGYIGRLQGQLANVHSPQGRADLSGYINALQHANGPADAPMVLNAILKVQGDCP